MDNYNDSSPIIDGNFDDYDTLFENICGLKVGNLIQVPVYDFKSSFCVEGIYALSEKLWPLLDLHVSIAGGVNFDLVKRVLQGILHAGQAPQEIIHQILETAFIETNLQIAHMKIINKFNLFTIKAVLSEDHKETTEETYDIYLLPPGDDPKACQSFMRMRNMDGKYNLMFEEWVTDTLFIISPWITFEVSTHLLGGLKDSFRQDLLCKVLISIFRRYKSYNIIRKACYHTL
ncbi:hypothetical protein UlMin_018528 [Ulmus minor]